MVAELISVGTEILLGNIVNTNANYLSQKCAELGITNYFQISVGDNEERLSQVLETALSRSDVVILTGGLGPTKDDLTKEVAAQVLKGT
jgi:nicotinamide-nucleotide amidase